MGRPWLIFELLIVLAIGFAPFIYASTVFLLGSENEMSGVLFTDSAMHYLIIYECIALFVILIILKLRRFPFNSLIAAFSWRDSLDSLFLIIGIGILNGLLTFFLSLFDVANQNQAPLTPLLSEVLPISFVLFIVINPFFEEILLIGYLHTRLAPISPFLFTLVGTFLRLSYHTYQGVVGITGALALSIVFNIYYLKTNRLSPIIVAHALLIVVYFLYHNMEK